MGDVSFAADGRASWRLRPTVAREAALCTGLAAVAASLLAWLAPPGNDLAAHEYQRSLFLVHGFTLWDNFWYAGRYALIGYSVLYYPLAAFLGIWLLAVLTVAVSAAAFALILEREWGSTARWAGRAFALVWPGVVLLGQLPFALGAALALLCLLALQSGRRWTGAVLIVLTLAASPIAFLLLAVVLVGVTAGRRLPWRRVSVPALALALAVAAELAVMRLFPAGGTLEFPVIEAVEAVAFCAGMLALTWRSERARGLRGVVVVYLLVVIAAYAIPSGVGHDVVRLRQLALPLALLAAALGRWRPLPLALAVVVLAGAWNILPLAGTWVHSADDPSSQAAVWAGPTKYLRAHLRAGYRVEAVDTSQHWPALYLARADIPLVRGWFREDDHPVAMLLYRPFTAAQYVAWLRRLGVAYVVLANAPLDFSSRREAALIRSGQTGLRRVFRAPFVSIYAVPRPRAILTGPGRPTVLALRESRLVVRLTRGGTYRLAVRWSPYWHASTGCLTPAQGGMLRLQARTAGTVQIGFDVDPSSLSDALTGTDPSCPKATGPSK
jgi:hypothetical protein